MAEHRTFDWADLIAQEYLAQAAGQTYGVQQALLAAVLRAASERRYQQWANREQPHAQS
jgi:hypothetical protein